MGSVPASRGKPRGPGESEEQEEEDSGKVGVIKLLLFMEDELFWRVKTKGNRKEDGQNSTTTMAAAASQSAINAIISLLVG